MSDDRDFYVDGKSFGDLSMNWEQACSLCFSNDDVYTLPLTKAHPIIQKNIGEWVEDEAATIRYLLAPAAKVRRRMEVQGYTREACRALWQKEHARHLASLRRLVGSGYPNFDHEVEAQQGLTFEAWQSRIDQLGMDHMLAHGGIHLFSFSDMFAALALEIDAYKPQFVWTEVGDDFDYDPELTLHENLSRGLDDLEIPFIETTGNVLIVTEGTSDTKILSRAIRAMYPEFSDMFEFVDFEEFKIEGGVSLATKMIKAFAGVRMTQRILAIFDNDAAGIEQKLLLDRTVKLPASIKVMLLPDIEIARDYPTLGPEGLRQMDINGSATSIELFLGAEALGRQAGSFRPVRWSSWNKTSQKYQGKLENKSAAAEHFLSALKSETHPHVLRRRFPEMDHLLRSIFGAFG